MIKSLRKAREEKGLSREDVARLRGLDLQWITDLVERRELNASVSDFSSYAAALGQQLVMALLRK